MTATTTTTSQINDLIGWMRKNNRSARAARFLVHCFDVDCKMTTTTQARSGKFFILCLYVKTIRTKQTKVQFACFVKRDKHGIIVKTLDLTKSFMLTSRLSLLLKLPNARQRVNMNMNLNIGQHIFYHLTIGSSWSYGYTPEVAKDERSNCLADMNNWWLCFSKLRFPFSITALVLQRLMEKHTQWSDLLSKNPTLIWEARPKGSPA